MIKCQACGDYLGEGPDDVSNTCRCTVGDGGYFAAKRDQDKLRPSLLPWDGVWPVLRVAEYGARKYAAHSWRNVPDAEERYSEAFRRHALACMGDIWSVDEETGLPHLAHAAWNALALFAIGGERG